MKNHSPHLKDLETISAYLDGEIKINEKEAVEARLKEDQEFHHLYLQLLRTRTILRAQPLLRAPRNYTLHPQMVQSKTSFWEFLRRPFVFYQYASAVLSLVFGIWFCFNILFHNPIARSPMALAPAPMYETSPITPSTNAANKGFPLAGVQENSSTPEAMLKMAPGDITQSAYPSPNISEESGFGRGEATPTQIPTEAPLMKAFIETTATPMAPGEDQELATEIAGGPYPNPPEAFTAQLSQPELAYPQPEINPSTAPSSKIYWIIFQSGLAILSIFFGGLTFYLYSRKRKT